jgi:hypothetical protein
MHKSVLIGHGAPQRVHFARRRIGDGIKSWFRSREYGEASHFANSLFFPAADRIPVAPFRSATYFARL